MVDLVSGATFGFLGGAVYGGLSFAYKYLKEKENFDAVRICKTLAGTTIIGGIAGFLNLPIDAISTMSVSTFIDVTLDRLWNIVKFA